MSKTWSALIIIGVGLLFVLFAWEIIQITGGARSAVNQIVIAMPRSNLIPGELLNQFTSSNEFLTFLQREAAEGTE